MKSPTIIYSGVIKRAESAAGLLLLLLLQFQRLNLFYDNRDALF